MYLQIYRPTYLEWIIKNGMTYMRQLVKPWLQTPQGQTAIKPETPLQLIKPWLQTPQGQPATKPETPV